MIVTTTHQRYSAEDDALLRAHWPDVALIASLLGRSAVSVKQRGLRLGLRWLSGRAYRLYSEEERELVRQRYAAEGAKPLARELGRSRACIVALAERLGVHHLRRWTAEEDAQLAELRRAGRTAPMIADALDRSTWSVNKRFQDLDLTVPYDPVARRRQLVTPRRPTSNTVEVRWARARMRLGEHGWPPDLNPKEITILESLRTKGPQSRIVLSASIGEPPTRHPYKRLYTHGGRSAMARLMARGLVARLHMNEGRQRLFVYALTRAAEEARGTFESVASFHREVLERNHHGQP